MAHVRTQIRDALVAALMGLTTTAARVYSGRTRPLAADHLPTLLVYATDEESDVEAAGANPILLRRMTLAVEGRAVAAEAADLENTLDQIALEVEPVVVGAALAALTLETTLVSSRLTAQSPGENHAGEIRMEFRVLYRTRENAPQTAV